MPPFVTAAGVASLIGMADAAAFLRARDRLEQDHGFPLPMPTSRRPLLWRRETVAAWVEAQGHARDDMANLAAIIAASPNVRLLEKARAA